MTTTISTWIAAIDIGTSYSCYGYAPKSSPYDVKTSSFKDGHQKTPTSILLSKNKTLIAFGQEAEDIYQEQLSKNDTSKILFKEFKMEIHDNPNLSISKTMATDISGKIKVPVFSLITMAIQYLKNDMVKVINCAKETYSEDAFQFVLTCPAIWGDRAKYFLRQAGIKAGIKSDCLTLAYESESVSLWCKTLNGNQVPSNLRTPGTKYAVVNIGGGIVDISHHESTSDMVVNTLSPARGGIWGGIVADKCFKTYLSLLFGPEVFEQFQNLHCGELYQLMIQFENIKRAVAKDVNNDQTVKITVPKSLINLALKHHSLANEAQLSNKVKSSYLGNQITLSKQTLEMDSECVRGMFDYTAKQIAAELQELTSQSDTIVLTGELADIVQSKLVDMMASQKIKVIPYSSMFTAMGAVLYGHNTKLVKTRVSNLTYGIKTVVGYNDKKHAANETTVINGTEMCDNRFHVLLKSGTRVENGYEVKEDDRPLSAEDKFQTFEIFTCGKKGTIPTLTSDPTVTPVSKFVLPLPAGCLTEDKIFERRFTFGETEIQCQITFKKGKRKPDTFYLEFK